MRWGLPPGTPWSVNCPTTSSHLGKVAPRRAERTHDRCPGGGPSLNASSVSNPENLRNCEGLQEGAGVKGRRAFYYS